jgi:hypothetical protein
MGLSSLGLGWEREVGGFGRLGKDWEERMGKQEGNIKGVDGF